MMNVAFSRILKLGERKWEFNFRRKTAEPPCYHVDVTDERGGRVLFSMYKSQTGEWRSEGGRLPLWIVAAEATIGEAIDQEESLLH